MGQTSYKVKTKDMGNCVEKLIKWIEAAEEMNIIIPASGSAHYYLDGSADAWYFEIDGEKHNLEDALQALIDAEEKKNQNTDDNDIENDEMLNKTSDRLMCLQNALDCEYDLEKVKKLLKAFPKNDKCI